MLLIVFNISNIFYLPSLHLFYFHLFISFSEKINNSINWCFLYFLLDAFPLLSPFIESRWCISHITFVICFTPISLTFFSREMYIFFYDLFVLSLTSSRDKCTSKQKKAFVSFSSEASNSKIVYTIATVYIFEVVRYLNMY